MSGALIMRRHSGNFGPDPESESVGQFGLLVLLSTVNHLGLRFFFFLNAVLRNVFSIRATLHD